LGLTFQAAGETTVAKYQLTRALESRRELAARNPRNAGARGEVAQSAAALADVLLEQGDAAAALSLYKEASRLYSELRSKGSLTEEVGSEPSRVAATVQMLTNKLGNPSEAPR
jgi:hypothetical protein